MPPRRRLTLFAGSSRSSLLTCCGLLAVLGAGGTEGGLGGPGGLQPHPASAPSPFVENRGQWPIADRFRATFGRAVVAVESTAVRIDLPGSPRPVRLRFPRAAASTARGEQPVAGRRSYLRGSDRRRWVRGATAYRSVRRRLYPGADLVCYANGNNLEFDLDLAPGADPGAARIHVEGAGWAGPGSDGSVCVTTPEGTSLTLLPPITYQMASRRRVTVPSRWVRHGRDLGFQVGDFDPSRRLIIDPQISFSTFQGGTGFDIARTVGRGLDGSIYVAGLTEATNFPTANPLQPNRSVGFAGASNFDCFIARYSPDGTRLIYSTYLGGAGADDARALVVNPSGDVWVAGSTSSYDFPTEAPLQRFMSGAQDAFVLRLDALGDALIYSSYLGGSGVDAATDLDVGVDGSPYLTGNTGSTDFPLRNPLQDHFAGFGDTLFRPGADAFVSRLTPDGGDLVFSTYLGGSSGENSTTRIRRDPGCIRVDSTGAAWVGGATGSADFPLKNPTSGTLLGFTDGFLTRISPEGTLLFSTFIGHNKDDFVSALAVDGSDNVYVGGCTDSPGFPVLNAFQPVLKAPIGGEDAFLMKLDPTGRTVRFSTFLGGQEQLGVCDEVVQGIAVDRAGNVAVCGFSDSRDFPSRDSLIPFSAGIQCLGFVTFFAADGQSLLFSTALGNPVHGVVVDDAGGVYCAGQAVSGSLIAVRALQAAPADFSDAFVAALRTSTALGEPRASTGSVHFGEVALPSTPAAVGSTRRRTVTIRNTGRGVLVLKVLAMGGAWALEAGEGEVALAPGRSWPIRVRFAPTSPGVYRAPLEVQTSNFRRSRIVIPCDGKARRRGGGGG